MVAINSIIKLNINSLIKSIKYNSSANQIMTGRIIIHTDQPINPFKSIDKLLIVAIFVQNGTSWHLSAGSFRYLNKREEKNTKYYATLKDTFNSTISHSLPPSNRIQNFLNPL